MSMNEISKTLKELYELRAMKSELEDEITALEDRVKAEMAERGVDTSARAKRPGFSYSGSGLTRKTKKQAKPPKFPTFVITTSSTCPNAKAFRPDIRKRCGGPPRRMKRRKPSLRRM